ncbi:hypothetical protein D9M72_318550 [compost metagenome]
MFHGRSVAPVSIVRLTTRPSAPVTAMQTCPGASPYGLPDGPAAPLSQMPHFERWASRMRPEMKRA